MTPSTPASVLVVEGDTRSAVAIARSLGKRGIPVWVGASTWSALGALSRHARGRVRHPSPALDPEGFAAAVDQACTQGRGDLIFPTTDVALGILSGARGRFPARSVGCLPAAEALELVSDKASLLRLAAAHGVPMPQTHFVRRREDVERLAPRLSYPVVVKTRRSRVQVNGRWRPGARAYAATPLELIGLYDRTRPLDPQPLIQECVPGYGCAVFVLANRGEVRALFAHRRIRENPPWGGVSVLSESCEPHPVARDSAVELLRALRWHGVAMVEFRHDARDQIPKLMEINARFWGSLELAIQAGVDFPYLLYRMAQDGDVAPVTQYRVGLRNRWLIGDFDRLVWVMRGRQPVNGMAPLARWREAWEFARTGGMVRLELERADDPLPALGDAAAYACGLVREVVKRAVGARR